ncbi:MAG: thioesterase family protein [Acidimicrobiia bacterium]
MGQFDDETTVRLVAGATDDGVRRWSTQVHEHWSIGENPNGGYAMIPLLRAMGALVDHPDPLSVTAHFLRPAVARTDAGIEARVLRSGRSSANASATSTQGGKERIVISAVFGDLSSDGRAESRTADWDYAPEMPSGPGPEECVDRRAMVQGIELPILSRLDVRIPPGQLGDSIGGPPIVDGWIRFRDGTPPSVLALVLFADAFPPAMIPKLGEVGWVPTMELTVHLRRRPVDGWIRGRFECDDLQGGLMIETGTLWDASGAVVARSRQLGLLMTG